MNGVQVTYYRNIFLSMETFDDDEGDNEDCNLSEHGVGSRSHYVIFEDPAGTQLYNGFNCAHNRQQENNKQ